ncbi:uncharacterized protein [Rutidosis leptorrhynchoides]|uniref:uncharacterized protein n=1 Tax=Rutidosis leptorrhynchoides TaxID=125765 RepID=UPI003A9977E0
MAKLLESTDLIVWDEAPMNNKRCFEVLDRSLRDILRNKNSPFGARVGAIGKGKKHCFLRMIARYWKWRETLQNPSVAELQQKAIVCPKNDAADTKNKLVVDKVDRPVTTYASGLCNSTRMIVTQLPTKAVEDEIITGTRVGEKIFFPGMNLIHKEPTLPYVLKRQQFPLKVSYAMNINKSQGQSLNKIGVYLPKPIVGHGQLMAQITALAQLAAGDRNWTITARIYRKWVTYNFHTQAPNGYCCMLIDEMSYPMLVNMRYSDKDFFG